MKTVKYVPKICQGENAKFSGDVELRLTSFDEKFDYLQSSGIEFDSDGKVNLGDAMSKIKSLRAMVRCSEKHYISVSLKNLKTGEELKSFEDLSYDTDAQDILIEVATQLMNGFKLGND